MAEQVTAAVSYAVNSAALLGAGTVALSTGMVSSTMSLGGSPRRGFQQMQTLAAMSWFIVSFNPPMTGFETENALSVLETFTIGEVPWDAPSHTRRHHRRQLLRSRQKFSSTVLLDRVSFWLPLTLLVAGAARRVLAAVFAHFDDIGRPVVPMALMFPRVEMAVLFLGGGPCAMAAVSYLADRDAKDGVRVFLALVALSVPLFNIAVAFRVVSSAFTEAFYATDDADIDALARRGGTSGEEMQAEASFMRIFGEGVADSAPCFGATFVSRPGRWVNALPEQLPTTSDGKSARGPKGTEARFVERWGGLLRPFRAVPITRQYGVRRHELSPLFYIPLQLAFVYTTSAMCGLGQTADAAVVSIVAVLISLTDAITVATWQPYWSRIANSAGVAGALASAAGFAIVAVLFAHGDYFGDTAPSRLPTAALAIQGSAAAIHILGDGVGIFVQVYLVRVGAGKPVPRPAKNIRKLRDAADKGATWVKGLFASGYLEDRSIFAPEVSSPTNVLRRAYKDAKMAKSYAEQVAKQAREHTETVIDMVGAFSAEAQKVMTESYRTQPAA